MVTLLFVQNLTQANNKLNKEAISSVLLALYAGIHYWLVRSHSSWKIIEIQICF